MPPVTLATPSIRPRPRAVAARPCRPGKVSRVTKPGGSAAARRDRASEMPLAVTSFAASPLEIPGEA